MAEESTKKILRIVMRRGDNFQRTFTIIDQQGNVLNITGWAAKFTVKEYETDTYANAKIKKSTDLPTEILISAPASGQLIVYIIPADTSNLDIKTYYYDLEMTTDTGKIYTTHRSEFTILYDITDG